MWRRFFHIHTCCWEYTVGANTLHYFLNKAAIVTQWKRCNYRIFFWGVWKSKHAQNKVLKKLCQTSVLWGLSSHVWSGSEHLKIRASLPTSKWNGHVWIWQVVPHFKVKSGGFDAVVLSFECQKSLKTPKRSTGKNKNSSVFMNRTKVHNTWDSLGNTLWIDIICSWKQSLDLLHLHHHLRTVHVHYRTCAAVWCAG